MTARRLSPDEWATFRDLRLEALRTVPEAFAASLADWARLAEADWRQRLDAPVVAAFDGARPMGLAGLIRETSAKRRHRATLVMMYVRPEGRGRGTAEALIAALEEEAIAAGIRQIELAVAADNLRAIAFYRRIGFAEFGRVPDASLDGARFRDDLLMYRPVGARSVQTSPAMD